MNNLDIEDINPGRVGQGKRATCRDCGEVIERFQGGDLDDWWYSDFLRMCEDHICT